MYLKFIKSRHRSEEEIMGWAEHPYLLDGQTAAATVESYEEIEVALELALCLVHRPAYDRLEESQRWLSTVSCCGVKPRHAAQGMKATSREDRVKLIRRR